MTFDFTRAPNPIKEDHKYPLAERSAFAEIVVLATSKTIGIYGTSSSVNASSLL